MLDRLTRRSTIGLAAAVGLGGSVVAGRPARAATKLRMMTYFFAEPGQGGLFQAARDRDAMARFVQATIAG